MAADVRRKFYRGNVPQEQMQHFLWARRVAKANIENATQKMEANFNKHARPHDFQPGQLVLLQENYFLHKNAKLAPKFSGPHTITHLKGEKTVELKLKSGRRTVVSVDQIKPYREKPPVFMPEEPNPEELNQKPLRNLPRHVGLNKGGGFTQA